MSEFMSLVFGVAPNSDMSRAEITLAPQRDGRCYVRVHLCSHEDWSGMFNDFDAALAAARQRSRGLHCSKCGAQ